MHVLAVVIGLVWLADARLPAQRTTILQGQILAEADGQSLPRARVTFGAARQVSALSDDTGRFRLTLPAEANNPAAGRITIAKAGFATLVTTVALTELAGGRPLTFRLQRSTAVSGRVVDRQGNAVTSALVAVRPAPLDGARPGSSSRLTVLAETNDLGEYRVAGLGEGRYAVVVVDGPSPDSRRVDSWNAALAGGADPDTTIPDAKSASVFVQLQPGRDVEDLLLTTRGPTQMPGLCPASPAAAGEGTGVISGRVINQRGEPVMCAVVRLLTRGREPVVATDAEGHFEFTGLPAGRYGLEATKILHLTGRYGSDRSGAPSTRITLAEGRTLRAHDILLPTGSAITGTVVDEAGEPVAGVTIRALRPRGSTGLRFASNAFGAPPQRTDDRGRFRLFGLLPGRYFVAASTSGGTGTTAANEGWPSTLYPGTTDAALAPALQVEAGRDLSGIDITLGPPPAARVTGFAFDADGQPARGVLLSGSHRTSVLLLEPRTTTAGPDGAFTFPSVPPGEYVVQTTGPIGGLAFADLGRSFHFGMAYVTVGDRDPPPVTIRAGRGSVVEGRVVAESGGSTTVSITTIPTDFDRSPILGTSRFLTMRSDGGFHLEGITGPRRIVKAGGPDESYLRSAVVNGRDALDTPFDFGLGGEAFRDVEVVVANDSATVSGQVVDARQNPVEQYVVRVFSTDPAQWYPRSQRLKIARPGSSGRFRITGLPPGDYWMVAAERSEDPIATSDEPEQAQLEELSRRAERVTLGPSDARQFTLTLGGK